VLRTSITASGLALVVGTVAAPTIASQAFREPRLAVPLVILLAAGVVSIGLRLVLIALQATRRMWLLVQIETGDLLVRATLSVLAALAGLGALGAIAGQALGGLASTVAAIWVYVRLERRETAFPSLLEMLHAARYGAVPMRRLLGFGISIVVERDLRIVVNAAPVALLGVVATTSEVAHLRVALSYMALPSLLYDPIARVLMVAFPELRLTRPDALASAYRRALLGSSLLVLLVAACLSLAAPIAIPLIYGDDYRASAALAPWLSVAAVAGAANSVSIPLLRSMQRVGWAACLGSVLLATAAAPLIAAIVAYGASGAAAAYAVATLLLAGSAQWVTWRSLRQRAGSSESPAATAGDDAPGGSRGPT
jgi:O-antigen/teichoic acid export membrane protein